MPVEISPGEGEVHSAGRRDAQPGGVDAVTRAVPAGDEPELDRPRGFCRMSFGFMGGGTASLVGDFFVLAVHGHPFRPLSWGAG